MMCVNAVLMFVSYERECHRLECDRAVESFREADGDGIRDRH